MGNADVEIIKLFKPISLLEIESVKLMNRIDTKYTLAENKLFELLEIIKDDYFILEINKVRNSRYHTTYFDTPDDKMYVAHHNGRSNRFKVRHRSYLDSKISFLEIKFKNNKKRTIKTRIQGDLSQNDFDQSQIDFLEQTLPFEIESLKTKLHNSFNRITLVNKNFKERCTIDTNISFKSKGKETSLQNMSIVEVKNENGSRKDSRIFDSLRELHIRPTSISKYCIGRVLSDAYLKSNTFKRTIIKIRKSIIQPKLLSHNG